MMHSRWAQAGHRAMGLVIGIVLLLILIMAVLQLHQAFFGETVFGEVVTAQLGALATTISESALEEAELALRTTVNNPDHAAFSQFRDPLKEDPADGFEIGSLTGVGAKTREILAQPQYQQHGFTVSIDPPKVLFRKLFENQVHNYNEHFGTIAYRAVTRTTRSRTPVERVVETTQDFKVVAAGPVDAGDRLSVVALGTLAIKGNFTGSLAAMASYRIEAPSVITGTLLLDKPTAGSLANLTVRHDPKISGYRNGKYSPRYFYVGLAPRLAGKKLHRKATN